MKISSLSYLCIIAYSLHGVLGKFLRVHRPLTQPVDTVQAHGALKIPATAVANSTICNISLPSYDDVRCFEHALGRTRAQLQAQLQGLAVLNSTGTLTGVKSTKNPQCARLFYLPSFSEFEKTFPGFGACHITTYAGLVQSAAMHSPCRAQHPSEAEVVMLPPYSALECNWPAYGGGDCEKPANTYRYGIKKCHQELVDVGAQFPGKRILLIDQNPYWEPYNLPKASYAVEGQIWAKVNSLSGYYRPHVDFSMPPAAVDRCRFTPDKAYDEPVSQKRFFMSFKGNLQNAGVRQSVYQLFNNGQDQLITESSDTMYDFDELLQSSRFNLILRGDVEFTYRFNEAVCSGGVPVLVTDHMIPPFNEFLPFESYGVLVHENNVGSLVDILKALPDHEVETRRKNARAYCQEAFRTTEASVSALLSHLTSS